MTECTSIRKQPSMQQTCIWRQNAASETNLGHGNVLRVGEVPDDVGHHVVR